MAVVTEAPWSRRGERRLLTLWLILIAISVVSLGSVQGFAWLADDRVQAVTIMSLAFIKVRNVVLDFMEIRHAPPRLRVLLEAWMAIVWIAIVLMSVVGRS